MNPSSAEILTNPHPCGHIVYPYTDDEHVAEAVCLFASAGLRKDEAVLLIMTTGHAKPIRQRLGAEGFDLPALESTGQLVCENAERLLSTFLFDGIIDEERFKSIVGGMILRARAGGKIPNRPVRLFGEMVDLLWRSDVRSTQRLEELWNEVIEAHSVPLLCAYSLAGTQPGAFPPGLLACHSHAAA
jgi:hypothetical protein